MPIAPRFHIDHVHDLALQIKRAPLPVRLNQLQTIESLIFEIEDETLYPLDYIVYRITGYRSDGEDQPMLLGSALVGDLVATVAVVSHSLNIPAESALTVEETAKSLGVSARTISRLRREGLPFRWVAESTGRKRLGCVATTLQLFREKHKERISSASGFSRLSQKERNELVNAALQYSGSGRSLSDVAEELSIDSGRGHETIRSLLKRSPKARQVLEKPPPITRTEARRIEQEINNGNSWASLAGQHDRTVGALRKAVLRLRATRLKQLDIPYVELASFSRIDADEIILGASVSKNVSPPILELNPTAIKNPTTKLNVVDETTAVSAMHLLRRRAFNQARELDYSPNADMLDRIETDLRWTFLLQQDLILIALPTAIAVLVQHIGRPLDELPSKRLVVLMNEVIHTVADVCSTLDPSKGQTIEKTPAFVLDRFLSASSTPEIDDRAAAKRSAISLSCPFHDVVPWSTLIPRKNLPKQSLDKSIECSEVVALKYGWSGRPLTVIEIAQKLDRKQVWVRRQLRGW